MAEGRETSEVQGEISTEGEEVGIIEKRMYLQKGTDASGRFQGSILDIGPLEKGYSMVLMVLISADKPKLNYYSISKASNDLFMKSKSAYIKNIAKVINDYDPAKF